MRVAASVFFVFDQHAVQRIESERHALEGVDCVVAGLPGVVLDSIPGNVDRLTLEAALERYGVRQRAISERASCYALQLLNRNECEAPIASLGAGEEEGVRLALLNHVALLTHNAFAFGLLFAAMASQGMSRARCFNWRGSYRMIERLDIKALLHVDLGFAPQLEHLCAESGVALQKFGSSNKLALLRNEARTSLVMLYKMWVYLNRSRIARGQRRLDRCDAVFVVRAQTEFAAAEPILRRRAELGFDDCLLADDLIKSPNCTAAVRASGLPWAPLHSWLSPWEMLRTMLYAWCKASGAAQKISKHSGRLTKWGFLGRSDVVQAILRTAFSTVPELIVFSRQIDRALSTLRPETIVSMDTVDRWGAIQGASARRHGIRSVMVQNTAVDDIEYPLPLSTDHLVVGSERLRRIFIASGASAKRVHAFGLPLQDAFLKAGRARFAALNARPANATLRILVATQPFVQEFDYNGALLADLARALAALPFSVELVIKPHPREMIERYREPIASLEGLARPPLLFDGPFEAALDIADVLVSRTSTSLEFAALGGVPGIAHLDRYPAEIVERLDYLRDPVTIKTFDAESLSAALAFYAPETRLAAFTEYASRREAYLAEYFPGCGRATERVAALIAGGHIQC